MRAPAAHLGRGLLMGLADLVPGVSGGTIALVLGIYPRLVHSIRSGSSALGCFVRGDVRAGIGWLGRVEWLLLVPLSAGILLAVVLLAGTTEQLLHDHPTPVAALFGGLVAGSVLVAWRMLERRDLKVHVTAVASAATFFILLGVREGLTEETVTQASEVTALAFFLSGAVAVCAMILPGISGSLILVLLGMYGPVLAAVDDRELGSLAFLLAGATLGLALFSQLLDRALSRYHDQVLAVLIGLMAGSLRVLWPWPSGLEGATLGAPDHDRIWAVTLALLGIGVVVGLNRLASRADSR